MRVLVNGRPRDLPAGATVSTLVQELGGGDRGVAVAIGEEVVPRSAWETTALGEGVRVEVLTAVQGG